VARSIPAERYDARRATRVLDELLRDGDSLDRARAVAERVRAETGVRTAVDAIERSWSYEGGAGAGSCRKVVIRVSTTSGRVKGRKWSAPGTIAS